MPERRNKGKRRWGLEYEFPVKGSDGIPIIVERRRISDRRLSNLALKDLLMTLSEMSAHDSGRKS